ncbi:MAG TPA: hypothetical protein PLI95_30685 [Polyangiaceae bacterium]|nr:hypothetical protein [Polyangiaceae bacterium]
MNLPDPGLYRTTQPYPGKENEIPAGVLVYVGVNKDGVTFVVRPGSNKRNRWFWGEPTTPLRSTTWGQTLKSLPGEGFYTLPQELQLGEGGVWRKNAIVQLGYNAEGRGILFVGEDRENETNNVLHFSDKGILVEDDLLFRLQWAPILPVSSSNS